MYGLSHFIWVKGTSVISLLGQVIYLYYEIHPDTQIAKITVEIPPPTNPSTVLFGDSLMSLVLPKSFPKTNAIISLIITEPLVMTTQKNPL
jgi:hypothetical protein